MALWRVLDLYKHLFLGIEKAERLNARLILHLGGVGGIRTRVPLITTTRFPVVLVTTTSIPLRNCLVIKLLLEKRFPLLSLTIITYVSRFCNCFRLIL